MKITPVAITFVFACVALLAVAAVSSDLGPTLTSPASVEKAPNTDGFIQRWLLLEPIAANGLTDSAVQAAAKKEYFANQFTIIPHDADKVTVGAGELTWHAVDTKNYNVNLYHFARALGKPTSDVLFWVVTLVNSPQQVRMCGWLSAPMPPRYGGSMAKK